MQSRMMMPKKNKTLKAITIGSTTKVHTYIADIHVHVLVVVATVYVYLHLDREVS